jgi:hypothetical protein
MASYALLGFGYGSKRTFPRYRQAPQGTDRKSLFQGYRKNNKVFFDFYAIVSLSPYRIVILPPIFTVGFILRIREALRCPSLFISASRTRSAREVFGFFVQFAQFSFQLLIILLLDIHPERCYNILVRKRGKTQ